MDPRERDIARRQRGVEEDKRRPRGGGRDAGEDDRRQRGSGDREEELPVARGRGSLQGRPAVRDRVGPSEAVAAAKVTSYLYGIPRGGGGIGGGSPE